MLVAHDRQKSYADLKRKPMEIQVGDNVMLKVSPWKGVVRFGKRGKLNPRVHNTFHVSNLKKCYADEPLAVPLDGLHFDDKLQFFEEPVEIIDCEVKRLRQSRFPIVKSYIPLRSILGVLQPPPITTPGSEKSNGYSLKDKNKAKTNKTEHGNGKSVKAEAENMSILLGQPGCDEEQRSTNEDSRAEIDGLESTLKSSHRRNTPQKARCFSRPL
ncbi:hypothetical protein Tco_1079807 [Tanacetum coccineum]|uniref:Reverse transcriptase domain-containing protein n=1 Tax=Tanacetum coccineum TaxID=301880 RepID=A0ABQ5HSX7_9ASTR